MSDLLNSASLVMIPSGYKEDTVYSEVPTNGNGDLSFTRASDGTRVNSAGLVEVCPWNLVQNSENFSAVWTAQNSTITTNSIVAPNGTTTADSLIASNGVNTYSGVYVAETTSVVKTISCYVKKGSKRWVFLLGYSGNSNCWFDLDNAVVGTRGADYSASSITSVGNGWYRIDAVMNSATGGSNNIGLYGADADNSNTCTGDGTTVTAYIWGYQANIGSTAKPYFPTTDRLNVPRLTYQNGGGGCPSLLLEKQSTNHILYSEDYSQTAWTKNGVSLTANNTTSPDGTTNADLLTSNDPSGSVYRMYEANSAGSDAVCTTSVYFKYGNWQYAFIAIDNYTFATRFAVFDLINITNTFVSSGYTATITSVGNGWYKCTLTGQTGINAYCQFGLAPTSTAYNNISIANGKTLYIWGTQREQSSYETSYIPSTSSSATRVADACSKTGISSLIGQTEGVLFVDINRNYITSSYDRYFAVDDADATIYRTGIYLFPEPSIDGRIYLSIRNNNTAIYEYTYNNTTMARLKIAMAYKSGDIAYYINGTQVATSSATFTFAHTLSRVLSSGVGQSVNQAILFPTRLTNAELASLTTI